MGLINQLGSRFKAEFAGQVIAAIAGAFLTVGLARLLEPEGYGLLFLAMSVFSVVRVFSKLGLAKSAARYIAEYKDQEPGQIPHILKTSLKYSLIAIIIVASSFYISHESIAFYIGEPGLDPLFILGILFIVFAPLTAYARLIAQGFEDIELAATIHALNRSTRLVFAIGLVLLGYSTVGALGGYIIGSLVASFVGLVAIYKRYYCEISASPVMESGLSKRILKYNIPLTITGMSLKIDKKIDVILVGFFLNPTAVSFYVISKQIVNFVQMPSKALGFSISPTYGKQKAAGELVTSATIFEKSLIQTLLFYIPAAAGIVIVAEPSIKMIFGREYQSAVPVLQVLSLYVILSSITHITDHPLDYLGRAKLRSVAQGIASTSNVILNIILIPILGVVGAAIATIVTHTFYVSIKLYIISSELPLNTRKITKGITSVGAVTCGMTVIIWFAAKYITGPFTLCLVIITGIGSWLFLSILIGVIDEQSIKKVTFN